MLLDYSNHGMIEAAQDDRYGNILNLPRSLDTSKAQVIEVETSGNKTTKVLYRIPYDDLHDFTYGCNARKTSSVKTVWLNRNDDLHRTLDTSKYNAPDNPAPPMPPEPVENKDNSKEFAQVLN